MHIKKEYMAPKTEWTLLSTSCQILQGSPTDGGMEEGGELGAPLFPSDLFDDLPGIL